MWIHSDASPILLHPRCSVTFPLAGGLLCESPGLNGISHEAVGLSTSLRGSEQGEEGPIESEHPASRAIHRRLHGGDRVGEPLEPHTSRRKRVVEPHPVGR